jgi:plasmid replication initiation protein
MEEKALAISLKRDYIISQANTIIRSQQDDLTILEARLIRLAIAQVVEGATDFKTYTCNISKLADFLGITRNNIYTEALTLAQSIMSKTIKLTDKMNINKNGEANYRLIHWVDSVVYENGNITFKLSEELKPYLFSLNAAFTQYCLEDILRLPTNNAIRLFELLQSYGMVACKNREKEKDSQLYYGEEIGIDEVIFTIDYLRNYFNCKDKYPITKDFIKRVIEPCVNAINTKTVMRTSYRTIKKQRKVEYIVFKINSDLEFTEEQWKIIRGEA